VIVEFIGCAGAGKTMLRRRLCGRTIAGRPAVAMADLVAGRPPLSRITHPTALNVVQELVGFPSFVRAWRRDPRFVAFARHLYARHARSGYDELNGMRGVMRKLGMYELARTQAPESLVLWDEGTLLTAYDLFVMTGLEFGRPELERLAALVPLPDVVVHVRAPVASLVARARSRPDPRRQHIDKDDVAVEREVRRTIDLFDLVASTSPLEGRVMVVGNEDRDEAGRQRLADEVADRLLDGTAVEKAGRTASPGLAAGAVAEGGTVAC